MKKEFSFGIIPLKKVDGIWRLFLVQHAAGHWAFPKGHSDEGESPKEVAERELKEETGLEVEKFLDSEPLQESYTYTRDFEKINKTVTYFLAEVSGSEKLQLSEIVDGHWVSFEEAKNLATFEEAKKLCVKVGQILEGIS